MKHPKGKKIFPHIHNKVIRKLSATTEVIYILKGTIKSRFLQ